MVQYMDNTYMSDLIGVVCFFVELFQHILADGDSCLGRDFVREANVFRFKTQT